MKLFRIEFGGVVDVMAENKDEALEKAAYECANDPINIMNLRFCEEIKENERN
jgi:NADH:ubiquinone oxidoreductase subunit 3 (subunit A)